jgi:hypothetical protein
MEFSMTTRTAKGQSATTPKFSDTAILVLSKAALRPDRLILPIPKSVKAAPSVVEKTILDLKAMGLVQEQPAKPKEEVWRTDEAERPVTLAITQSGITAVDGGFLAEAILPTERPRTKKQVPPKKARSDGKASEKSRSRDPSKGKAGSKPALRRRDNTKGGKILNLLKRSSGASLAEMTKATGWQIHSIRGFLSGTVKKRMGLKLTSEKAEGKDRRYKIPAKA